MPALQFEGSEIMVKLCRGPSIRRMTLAAVDPKAARMRIVLVMAGIAILQCHRKVSQTTRIEVTLHTGKPDMFAGELERKSIVIEALPESVHPVVAIETSRAKGDHVRGHEAGVRLTMATVAGVRGKFRNVAKVTVIALERRPRSRQLVAL